jgi:hypothetical protein
MLLLPSLKFCKQCQHLIAGIILNLIIGWHLPPQRGACNCSCTKSAAVIATKPARAAPVESAPAANDDR